MKTTRWFIAGAFVILLIAHVLAFNTIEYYRSMLYETQLQLIDTSDQLQLSVSQVQALQEEILKFSSFIQSPEYQYLEVQTIETTGYAPLDPNAVEGMCYSGNPNITASGEMVIPGISIAAPPHIPFGTWVWIEGLGWRRVDDRGSRIQGNRIDICFATRQEALSWGKRTLTMVIPHWNDTRE